MKPSDNKVLATMRIVASSIQKMNIFKIRSAKTIFISDLVLLRPGYMDCFFIDLVVQDSF